MMRLANGALRGLLTGVLVATPSLLLPGVSADTAQVVSLVGLAMALLVTVEYASSYPSLIEFRDAPPFNRIRFLCLFATVFLLSILLRGEAEASGFALFVTAVGHLAGVVLDVPFSPIRLLLLTQPETTTAADMMTLRAALGLSFFAAFFSFVIFYLILKLADWPRSVGAFNVWTNLPTFDPTTGSDVVTRLRRDGRFNLVLGALLPFLVPAVTLASGTVFGPAVESDGQSLIWMVAAWAFLPLSLFMRGIAMLRVADMIEEMRRRSTAAPHISPAVAPAE